MKLQEGKKYRLPEWDKNSFVICKKLLPNEECFVSEEMSGMYGTRPLNPIGTKWEKYIVQKN